MKENSARYVSHKDFLSQCIKSKLVPKGLELTLELTIGHFDQEFIDKWYYSLKEFSLTLMSHVATFCDKTIKETNDKIDQTDSILKYSKQSLKERNTKKSKKLLLQVKPPQRKFNINKSSRNTTTLNTNPNLLL